MITDFINCCLCFRSEINVKNITATLVVWLQNDNGYCTYKPSDSAVDAFLESYRPGRDKISLTQDSPTITPSIVTINNENSNTNNNNSANNMNI